MNQKIESFPDAICSLETAPFVTLDWMAIRCFERGEPE
jgi:hypothetical protein